MDLYGVWIALVSDSLICFAISSFRFSSGKWAYIKV